VASYIAYQTTYWSVSRPVNRPASTAAPLPCMMDESYRAFSFRASLPKASTATSLPTAAGENISPLATRRCNVPPLNLSSAALGRSSRPQARLHRVSVDSRKAHQLLSTVTRRITHANAIRCIDVHSFPGPWPHVRCVRHTDGLRSADEGADLLPYDPALEGQDSCWRRSRLAIDSGLAHPDVPL
jgi:hypothetical protein